MLKKDKNIFNSDKNLPSKSSSKDRVIESQNSACENTKLYNDQEVHHHQQQIKYLKKNSFDNRFADDGPSTLVDVNLFDDQLSTSRNSNTGRFSYQAAPLTTTPSPIILNGVIDTNLMHFTPSTTESLSSESVCCASNRLSEISFPVNNCDIPSSSTNYTKCDEDNISNSSDLSL